MNGRAPQLVRTLEYGDHGQDVKVVQRALHRAFPARSARPARNKKNGRYGAGTIADVVAFQKREGIFPASGEVGGKTWRALWKHVNAPDARIYGNFEEPPELTDLDLAMKGFQRFAIWFISHRATIRYRQWRPIPLAKIDVWNPRIDTDCSGSGIMGFRSIGAPDPSGNAYNGAGFTGDLRNHGRWLRKGEQRQVGDAVHYGSGSGLHVGWVVDPEEDDNFNFGSWPPRLRETHYRGDYAGTTRHALV